MIRKTLTQIIYLQSILRLTTASVTDAVETLQQKRNEHDSSANDILAAITCALRYLSYLPCHSLAPNNSIPPSSIPTNPLYPWFSIYNESTSQTIDTYTDCKVLEDPC